MKLLTALVAALFLQGCSYKGTGPEPGTLRMNLGTEPPSLDWTVSTDSTSFDVVSNLMVGLTRYTDKLTCRPACAKSWEILDAGKRYIFHLRHDVKWSDGKRLVASDFVYAWRRLLSPKTAAQYAYFFYPIENALEFNTGKLKDPACLGVRALDDFTLEVKLKKPQAYFIYLTAFCTSLPQRQDVIERWGRLWTQPEHIVTNGPFLLKEWKHEYKIELAANPLYFEGQPAIKKIKMFMIAEQATAFALYENDELDFVDNRSFSTADVERYRHCPEYHNRPLLRNNYIGFNVSKMPFNDKRVRQAISMALDRRIFPQILRRGEQPSYCWIPPALAGYAPDSGPVFAPGIARGLLARAGYPGGHKFPAVTLLYPNREDTRLVVEAIQDQLKRNLNIEIELTAQEWKVYLESLRRDAPPMYRSSWGADYPDPETFMNLFTSGNGNNYTRWACREYDRLIENAEGEQNQFKRAALYRQADRLLCREEAPIVCTFLSTQNIMVKPWVHGLVFNPLDMQFFEHVRIEPYSAWHQERHHPGAFGLVPDMPPTTPQPGAQS